MSNPIVAYQRAFKTIIEKLKANNSVLAVMVFGSMVTGDLWEESDIDFFVVTEKGPEEIQNIYTDENGINVHIKIMGKEKFLLLHEKNIKGGFIHRVFSSSRLVFSKDQDVTNVYNNGRYYPDIDKEKWNLVYLSRLLKNISICKKYICNDGVFTAYSTCIKCLEDYANLYINHSGYMISKDAMNIAINLDDKYKNYVEKLFFINKLDKELMNSTLNYILKNINSKLRDITVLLLEFMKKEDVPLSAENIKSEGLFQGYDIDFECILDYLHGKQIVKKAKRDYMDNNEVVILQENVYYL